MHSREDYNRGYPALDDIDPRSMSRTCPWCNSNDTEHVLRGFTGPTDDRNQYTVCNACDLLTWEIISRTPRDLRHAHLRVGGIYRDPARQTRYTITRILKVGLNEVLLYVKPMPRVDPERIPGRH